MFSLIKLEKSNGLSQVEDFIGHRSDAPYTHIQYTDGQTYIGEIGQPPEYFTASGWFKYLAEHISEFKFVDMYAVDRLVKIPMVLQIKPITIEDLQLEIKQLKAVIKKLIVVSNVHTRVLSTEHVGGWNRRQPFKSELINEFTRLGIEFNKNGDGINVKFDDV